jgi:hypothetical protein
MRAVTTAAAVAAAAGACVAGATPATALSTHPAPQGQGGSQTLTRSMASTADTYVVDGEPHRTHGDMTKLVASNVHHERKVTYLKFAVDDLIPSNATVTDARITLTRDLHHFPSTMLTLRRVGAHWRQGHLTSRRVPHVKSGRRHDRVSRADNQATFHVTRWVHKDSTYAFRVTSSSREGVARFSSLEGPNPPKLTVTFTVPDTTNPTPPPAQPPPAGGCDLSSELVPSCGVLLGGAMESFGGNTVQSQYDNFNADSGTRVVLEHDYRRPGQTLSAADTALANTKNTLLQLNWKPSWTWSDAAGGDASVNSQIDDMARSIKALGSHKIFLTLFHEPENDVSGGASGCPSNIYKGSAGTPADYRAMWANVERRFAALGVSNVVWVMNYMNYSRWDCMIDDLWPGNSLVDWIFFESYSGNGDTFANETGHFYNLLTTHSDAANDYLSKPWGIGEFGTSMTSASARAAYYDSIKTAIDDRTYPRLRLLSVYDYLIGDNDFRVAYDSQSQYDPSDLAAFDSIGNDPTVRAGDSSVAGGVG